MDWGGGWGGRGGVLSIAGVSEMGALFGCLGF